MLNLVDLDEWTRALTLAEVDHDLQSGAFYFGKRLTERGVADFPDLLKQAIAQFDDEWLADQLQQLGRLRQWETAMRKGRSYRKRVPYDANETLAEGEFNRFYARGLCLRAMEDGITELVIYRAKPVACPRPESELRIGMTLNPKMLLDDLRTHQGIDTALGVPAGPNSGLSVCLPTSYRTLSLGW